MPSYTVQRGTESFVAPDFPTLRQWATQGRIRADDLVWSQGWPEATKAYNVSGLREIFQQRNERPSSASAGLPSNSRSGASGSGSGSGSVSPSGSLPFSKAPGIAASSRPMPRRPRTAGPSQAGGLPSGRRDDKRTGKTLGGAVQRSFQEAAETFKETLVQGLAETAPSLFGGVSKGRRKTSASAPSGASGTSGGTSVSGPVSLQSSAEGRAEEDTPWLFLSASDYRIGLPDPAEEPIRYRLQEGPFWLPDLASDAESEEYLRLLRHRDIERPSRLLFAEYSPEVFAPILVESGILLAPQKYPDATEIGEILEDFFGIESPPALFLAPAKASAFGVAGDEEESFFFLGKALHDTLSRPQKAVALALLYARLYLMETRARTVAYLLGDPILFRRLQIEPPAMIQEATFLSWLAQSDLLADRIVYCLFQDLGLIQATYKVLAGGASVSATPPASLQEYSASPLSSVSLRLSALQRFAASPQAKLSLQKASRSPVFPDLQRLS